MPAMEGSARDTMGSTYISRVSASMSNVHGSPMARPMPLKMKIYARLGTAEMNMIYSVPNLSSRPSLYRAISTPMGSPRI